MIDLPVEEHECTIIVQFVHLVEIRNFRDVDYRSLGLREGTRLKRDTDPNRERQNFGPFQRLHRVSRP